MAGCGEALEISVPHPLEPWTIRFSLEDGARAPGRGGSRLALMQQDAVPQQGLEERISRLGQIDDIDLASGRLAQIRSESRQVEIPPQDRYVQIGVREIATAGG
jgi:hypothetical protein